ncbi:uncharacterized protein LOC127780350 [Oryza glaberrima]|uniref:uncharacterized protein LOC127780350 n=1 Tax=Oryza glaberrima TaxID=4538 RepID=UPI00224C3192|nr:uncharacterized protein LOC127780350 [Oryza glaberrima]
MPAERRGCRLPPHSGQLASPSGGAPSKAEKPSGGKKKGGWLKNIKSVAISFIQDKDSSGNSKSTPSTTTSSAADATSSSSSSASSSERLKAHQSGKSCKELTGLYMCQEIMAHEGSSWSIKFSTNGRWLASAGKDHVVCIWLVVEASSQACLPNDSNSGPLPLHPPGATPADGTSSSSTPTLSKKSVKAKSGRDTLPEPLLRAVGLPEPRHGGPHMVTRPIKFNPLDPFGLDDVNKAGPGGEKGKERKGKQSMTVVSTAGSTA